MNELNIDHVSALLAELGERLTARGIEGEIYVVGGAAMMLAYDRKLITRIIDAIDVPQDEIYTEVRAMAADHKELRPDWLDNRVLPMLPRGVDAGRLQVLGGPGLTVNVASPNLLLAMKACAARSRRDLDDLLVLCQILGQRTIDGVWQICDDVWGQAMIRDDVIDLVTDDLQARGLQ